MRAHVETKGAWRLSTRKMKKRVNRGSDKTPRARTLGVRLRRRWQSSPAPYAPMGAPSGFSEKREQRAPPTVKASSSYTKTQRTTLFRTRLRPRQSCGWRTLTLRVTRTPLRMRQLREPIGMRTRVPETLRSSVGARQPLYSLIKRLSFVKSRS